MYYLPRANRKSLVWVALIRLIYVCLRRQIACFILNKTSDNVSNCSLSCCFCYLRIEDDVSSLQPRLKSVLKRHVQFCFIASLVARKSAFSV